MYKVVCTCKSVFDGAVHRLANKINAINVSHACLVMCFMQIFSHISPFKMSCDDT